MKEGIQKLDQIVIERDIKWFVLLLLVVHMTSTKYSQGFCIAVRNDCLEADTSSGTC